MLVRRRNDITFALPRELLLQVEEPLEPSAQLSHDTFLLNIFSVAALTWLAYDMVLNFNREIVLVWKRWHEPKGRHTRRMYMLVRYFSLLNLAWYVGVNTSTSLSLNFCRAWYYIVVVNTSILALLPDVMLLIRVNSVYGWNIRTLLFTSSLFMIQLATSLVVGILSVTSAPMPSPSPSIPGCPTLLRRPVAQFTLVAWVPSILSEVTYLILMLNTLAHLMHGLGLDKESSSLSSSLLPSTDNSHNHSNQHSNNVTQPNTTINSNLSVPEPLNEGDNLVDISSSGHSEFTLSTISQVQKARWGTKSKLSGGNKLKKSRRYLKMKGKEREHATMTTMGSRFISNSIPNSNQNPSPIFPPMSSTPSHLRSKLSKPHSHPQLQSSPQQRNKAEQACLLCAHLLTVFSWTALQQVSRLVPTMMVFIGHGWVYFGLAICAKIVNAILVTTQSGPLQAAAIPWMMALFPVLVTRIYLSMVQYLHFGLLMKRPQLLASYDGENYEDYVGFEGDEWDNEGDFDDEDDYDCEENEGEGEPAGERRKGEGDGERMGRPSDRRRQGGRRRVGRITFAVRDSGSLASLAIRAAEGRDSSYSGVGAWRTFTSLTRSQSFRMSLSDHRTSIGGPVVLDFRDEEY